MINKIPKIDTEYNCFDDGKICESRKYVVKVTEVVPFNKIDKETLNQWKSEVKDCYWLYKEETDFFIKTTNSENEEEVFVRTVDNEWFGIGGIINCGLLDIDGKLTKRLV